MSSGFEAFKRILRQNIIDDLINYNAVQATRDLLVIEYAVINTRDP